MPQLIKSLLDLLKQVLPYSKSIVGFVVILTLCWLPQSAVQEPSWFHFPNADKVIHFGLFFVWAFCLQLDFNKRIHSAFVLFVVVLSTGLGTALLTETLQPIVSNRNRDFIDACFDIAGTLLSACLFPLFTKKDNS